MGISTIGTIGSKLETKGKEEVQWIKKVSIIIRKREQTIPKESRKACKELITRMRTRKIEHASGTLRNV